MTKADYAIQAVKGITETFNNGVQDALEVYKDNRVFDFVNSSEVFEIFTSTEGMNGVTELGDAETPPLMTLDDGYSVTIEEFRFGGGFTINEKTYRRDQGDSTMNVDNFIAENSAQAMKTAVHFFLTRSFELLNDAFTGTTFLAPDGKAMLADNHAWKSGATFDNKATAVLDEGGSAMDAAWEYAGAFTDASGKPMPLNWTHIIVKKGSAAARTAKKLFAESISPVAVGDINLYEGELTVVETPYISPANKANWFLRDANFKNSLRVKIGEFPTMREPIKLENEAVRVNITAFMSVGIANMPFDWYGSDGTV